MTETPQQAYISKVHLKGYKSIRDLEIDFKPGLNIIIGPNGSGKTNFLELLKSFHEQLMIKNTSIELRVSNGISQRIEYKNTNPYTIITTLLKKDKIIAQKETVEVDELITINILKSDVPYLDYFFTKIDFNNYITRFIENRIKSLEPGKIIIIRDEIQVKYNSNDNRDFLFIELEQMFTNSHRPNSLFMPLALIESNYISQNLKTGIYKFIENLKKHTSIQDIRLNFKFEKISERIDDFGNNIIEIDFNKFFYKKFELYINNIWIPYLDLSDGTKRVFYIIYQITFSQSNEIILQEEPELGIHPDQLYKLMDFLIEQSKEKQIIITTHSPEVLNAIHPDELDRIIVTRYDADKGTIMHKLTPEQAKEMGERVKEGDMFLSDRWVHLNLEDEIFNATKLNEK